MNRSGEGDGAEDSTVISASDRLSWYADFVALLKQKSEQDYALDGPGFGTHKLIPIKVRNQGRMAYGHQPFLDRPYPPEGNVRPCRFYINYEIDKFRVVEKHSLRQIVDRATEVYDVDEAPNLNDTNVSI
jgi:hypothetical protein